MNRIALALTIRVRSPFLFPGLAAGSFGLDAVALRDRFGRPLIPQDQVRGVLRHAAEEVIEATGGTALGRGEFALLFGTGSGDAAAFDPDRPSAGAFEPVNRSRILFSDLRAERADKRWRGFRVRLSEETGAADPGGLQIVELVAPHGAEVGFAGGAVLFATEGEAARWIPALQAAATWVSAIGAKKSSGFGEVVSVEVSEASRAAVLPASTPPVPAGRRLYRISIDRPFLVAARREAPNVYSGSPVIPGGALKGALAWKLALAGGQPEADGALTRLSISHARAEGAPDPMPLSMIVATPPAEPARRVAGDALLDPPGADGLLAGGVPRYRGDWKARDRAEAARHLSRPPEPELEPAPRMHVAIDPGTGTALREMLFVANAVEPGDRAWLVEVDYAAIEDPADRARLAAALEGGLDGVGRTGATLRFALCPDPPAAPAVRPVRGQANRFAVLLLSDAVMASPADDPEAGAAYAAYWSRVCPGARLVDFRASQRLAGGYVALRFGPAGGYAPFWLTEAGSVFLLEGDIADGLQRLVGQGLPAPWVNGRESDWRTCPYQRENGYGRIRADHGSATPSGGIPG